MVKTRPLVSIIIDTYYRPVMLQDAVEALRSQTYDNIEIVIVNNGATADTISYLLKLEKEEQRVKLVHYETNQFSWDDPGMIIRVCYNAGLHASNGELIFHQADDDWVASDFIERMVMLFEENPTCETAIGRCISAMPDGTLIPAAPAKRGRYIPGHELALDYATGSTKIQQSNPGHCFVMRRGALLDNGGFHETFEYQQMFAIVSFGITGYDPDALMYWRRHELQLNIIANNKNVYWGQYFEKLLSDPNMRMLERWREKYGDKDSSIVENYILEIWLHDYIAVMTSYFFNLRLAKAFIWLFQLQKNAARKRLSLEIVQSSFHSGAYRTKLGKMCLQFTSLLKGLVTDPILTINKVKRKVIVILRD